MAEKREIEIALKSKKAESSADRLNKKIKGIGTSADKTERSFFNLSKTAIAVGKGLVVSFAAVAASTLVMTNAMADYSKEVKIASQLSGVTVERLQLMAHATRTVGIDIEDLGDKFKDTREKIGDFLNTGGGGFMDFVDALRLTQTEARAVADEFSLLSGDQILQRMVTMMEEGNVSAVQMSHALEGMASDTTKLIPLLRDGGTEMRRLSDNMARVVIPLTDADIDLFIRMGQSTDIAAGALKSLGEQVLLDLGEAFILAADRAAHFYASLNEGTEAQKTTRLADIADEIKEIERTYQDLDNTINRFLSTEEGFNDQQQEGTDKINALLKERLKLQKELAASRFGIGEEPTSTASPQSSVGSISPGNAGTIADELAFDSLLARLQLETEAITSEAAVRKEFRDGLITEQELENALAIQGIFFQYEARRVAILENEKLTHDQKTELLAELNQQEIDAEALKQESITKITEDETDKRTQLELLAQNAKIDNIRSGASAGLSLLSAFGKKSSKTQKAFAIADAVVNIASGVAKALNNPYPANLGFAATVAAQGVGLLATIKGASPGVGSAPQISASSSTAPPPAIASEQNQARTINFVGLENFGPDDFIPMTKSQFIDYMGQDESVAIAVNDGQQNATRVGAI
ncbi:MAG: hypothetical protein JKY50_00375 [Oleispira sp.]|nr:hypothetical protein [Oleispira sp.]